MRFFRSPRSKPKSNQVVNQSQGYGELPVPNNLIRFHAPLSYAPSIGRTNVLTPMSSVAPTMPESEFISNRPITSGHFNPNDRHSKITQRPPLPPCLHSFDHKRHIASVPLPKSAMTASPRLKSQLDPIALQCLQMQHIRYLQQQLQLAHRWPIFNNSTLKPGPPAAPAPPTSSTSRSIAEKSVRPLFPLSYPPERLLSEKEWRKKIAKAAKEEAKRLKKRDQLRQKAARKRLKRMVRVRVRRLKVSDR